MHPNRKKQYRNELSAQRAGLLLHIYRTKNWGDITEFGNNEYEDFCEMLTYLTDEQQDLIIQLTKSFLKVGFNEYLKFFLQAFEDFIHSDIMHNKKRIFLLPLLRSIDFGKSKSSTTLYYIIKANIIRLQRKYPNYSIAGFDNESFLTDPNIKLLDSDIICPIDDFIGTGEYAIDAIKYLIEKGVNNQNIAIIALVGQEIGINHIKNNGYSVFVTEQRRRAISDTEDAVDEKKQIMDSIEAQMKVKNHYKMGYGQSEALIKMIHTPNNTFPIYWYAQSKTIPVVPFPRG